MGGVSLSVPIDNKNSYVKVTEGEDNDEYLIIRNDNYSPPLNIITLYGESESRVSQEEVLDRWNRFLKDLNNIEVRKESVIIASDLNKKLGNDELGIKGNSNEISFGGYLVRELIASGKYVFANNSNKTEGGPETRIDPADESKKSVLDVIILSKKSGEEH